MFPVADKGSPLVKWKPYQSELPALELLETWWANNPEADIALATGSLSGYVVVDIDSGKGEKSVEERAREILEQYPTDMIVRTPSGGLHLYYRHPGDATEIGNAVDGETGIDVRGDGGYTLLPPSDGYEWESTGEPGDVLPSFVLEPSSNGASPPAQRESGWAAEAMRGVEEGARDDTATRLAGKLLGRGLEPAVVEEMLLLWNLRNDPPLPSEQVRKCVRSIAKKEREKLEEEQSEERDLRIIDSHEFHRLHHGERTNPYLVEECWPDEAFGWMVGPPETWKSWMLYDLGISVASGVPFLGRFRVNDPGPVIILQLEDAMRKMCRRVDLLDYFKRGGSWPPTDVIEDGHARTGPLVGNLPLYYHDVHDFDLEEQTLERLTEKIRRLEARLVIVDPLFTIGETEDYMAGTAKRLQPLKQVRGETGCSFVFGHHTKLNESGEFDREDAWGSQFLNAAQNAVWRVRKTDTHGRIEVQRYFKDGARPGKLTIDFTVKRSLKIDDPEEQDWAYEVEVAEEDQPGRTAKTDPVDDAEIKRRIIDYVEANQPCSSKELVQEVQGDNGRVRDLRDTLEEDGFIANEGGPSNHRWTRTRPSLDPGPAPSEQGKETQSDD